MTLSCMHLSQLLDQPVRSELSGMHRPGLSHGQYVQTITDCEV